MKRFYADVFNTWTLLLTAKLITELKAAEGDEDEILSGLHSQILRHGES